MTMEYSDGEQELFLGKVSEVLPVGTEFSYDGLIGIIQGYTKKFQRIYSSTPSDIEHDNFEVLTFITRLSDLETAARSELQILDTILPIRKSAGEVIPWDISPVEREFYSNETDIPVTWYRYVKALGKYMAGAYPTIYTNNNQ